MNTKEQVLELLNALSQRQLGTVPAVNALSQHQRSRWQRWVNPFESLNPTLGLLLGAAGALAGVILSRWNVRFDGALDLHATPIPASVAGALLEQAVAWPLLAVVLWSAASLRVRQVRLVDFLSNVGVARLPYLIPALMAGAMKDQLSVPPEQLIKAPPPGLLLLSLVTVPAVVWVVTWLWQSFRTASGLRGPKAGLLFAGALLVAEVLSKIVLGFLSVLLHHNGL